MKLEKKAKTKLIEKFNANRLESIEYSNLPIMTENGQKNTDYKYYRTREDIIDEVLIDAEDKEFKNTAEFEEYYNKYFTRDLEKNYQEVQDYYKEAAIKEANKDFEQEDIFDDPTNDLVEDLEKEFNRRKDNRKAAYRRYANMEDSDIISESNIDEWALKRTSRVHNYDISRLKEELLEESKSTEAESKSIIINEKKLNSIIRKNKPRNTKYIKYVGDYEYGQINLSAEEKADFNYDEESEDYDDIVAEAIESITNWGNEIANYIKDLNSEAYKDLNKELTYDWFSGMDLSDGITFTFDVGQFENSLEENLNEIKENPERDKTFNSMKDDTDMKRLRESTIIDAAKEEARKLDAKIVQTKGQIEGVLDWALETNLQEIDEGGDNFKNVLLVGESGVGKTSRVIAWAKENNINLFSVLASTMEDTDLGGAIAPSEDRSVIVRLSSTEMDKLDRPNSVLFLDEYNRATKNVRGTLLTLIKDHVIPDNRESSGRRFLPNFLFTIAAMNPSTSGYDTDALDRAEKDRFRVIDIYPDIKNLKAYLNREFDKKIQRNIERGNEKYRKINEGRKALADTLLSSKDFALDLPEDIARSEESGNGLILSPRSFTNLITSCDGTKEDLLYKWNDFANSMKKKMAEVILRDYKDIDDKANEAIRDESESKVFKTSNMEKIYSVLNKE